MANSLTPNNGLDLNDPTQYHTDGQLFLTEAFKIIMTEVLCKGTDVNEKVCLYCICFVQKQVCAEIVLKLVNNVSVEGGP